MNVILWAFTLFHLMAGLASLGAAVRLLMPDERAHWRSPVSLLAAEFLVWIYPIAAYVAVKSAWREHAAGGAGAMPLMLSPLLWLVLMGFVLAIVDFLDDGIIGNARRR